jgi:hypothetical protein
MSSAPRRARRQQARRKKTPHHARQGERQSRELQMTLPLDAHWVAQLARISDRLAANLRECRSISDATAELFSMTGDNAADLLERYIDDSDNGGHHPQGLLGWLATSPEGVEVGVETPSGVQYVPLRPPAVETTAGSRPEPVVNLVVEYPGGPRVVVPTAMTGEGPERHYPLLLECDDSITDDDRRNLITETLDHLARMLPGYRAMVDTLRSNANKMRDVTPAELNAPGGAA